jgi:hypothetical protein
MDLIWAKREAIYFCGNGWTGSISLIGFDKFADWRKAVEAFSSAVVIHGAFKRRSGVEVGIRVATAGAICLLS